VKIIISALVLGLILIAPTLAEEKKKGHSTLPGWSLGYKFNLDLDDDKDRS